MSTSETSKRMRRKEFWLKYLGLNVASWVVIGLNAVIPWFLYISPVFMLALAVMEIMISIKRLHDTDRSGWNLLWILLPIAGPVILLVFFCQPSTSGANRFGEEPLAQ